MKVRVYGNTAVVTGKADLKGTLGGKDVAGQIRFTRVWLKKGSQWQSVAFQQTRVSNPNSKTNQAGGRALGFLCRWPRSA